MALIHELENSGNFLFRHRGQIPVVLFVMAVPVIWFTDYSCFGPNWNLILLSTSVLVSFLGLLIRSYTIGTTPLGTSGRNTDHQVANELNSDGIYSVVRHPLYLGNYLMWIGIVIFTFNIWFVVVVTLLYWLYYERIMFAEERFLERKFGEEYMKWSLQAPAFIPNFSKFKKGKEPFKIRAVLRREYSGFMATIIGFLFVAVVRDWVITRDFVFPMEFVWIFLGAGFVTVLLRSLKHYTNLLTLEDRS